MKVQRLLLALGTIGWIAGVSIAATLANETAIWLFTAGLWLMAFLSIALRWDRWPDAIFASALLAFVWFPLCYLAAFPEVFAYVSGLHRNAEVSERSILIGVRSLVLCVAGWTLVRLSMGSSTFGSLSKPTSVSRFHAAALLAWFAVSIFSQVLMTIRTGFGVAGSPALGNFAGYIYYLMPADALALMFAGVLGARMIRGRLIGVAVLLLAMYCAMKLYQGWKGMLIQTVVVYALFATAIDGWVVRGRIVAIACLAIAVYGIAIKPVANTVRIVHVTGMEWNEAAEGYTELQRSFNIASPIQSRLTEGTVNALLGQDERHDWDVRLSGVEKLASDVIEGIVPGDAFGERSLARIFTEDVLGQPAGKDSTFAPGILGTAFVMDRTWGGLIAGFFYAIALFVLVLLEHSSRWTALSVFLAGAGTLFIVESVTEGGSGRIEQILIWSFVISFFLSTIDKVRNFIQRVTFFERSQPRA